MRIDVAYALPDEQLVISLEVEEGTTVGEAIARSGIPGRFPGLRLAPGGVGIFGRAVELDAVVRDGDRVEIYRPLIVDPKEARRARARKPPKAAGC